MPGQRLYHSANAFPCSWEIGQASYRQARQRGYSRAWRRPRVHQPALDKRKPSDSTSECSVLKRCTFHALSRNARDWNVYLGRSRNDSSVYSLSRPSSVSPIIYAGTQNCITQIDVVSVLDQHPDPVYNTEPLPSTPAHMQRSPNTWSASAATSASHSVQAREMNEWTKKWDPEQQALCLNMYEQSHDVSPLPVSLTYQFRSLRSYYNEDE